MIRFSHKPPSARLVIEGADDLEFAIGPDGDPVKEKCLTAKGRELVATVTGDANEAEARAAMRKLLLLAFREVDGKVEGDTLTVERRKA